MSDGARCEHGNVTEELRSLVDAMAARAEPMVQKMAAAHGEPQSCTWCPVCAGFALLRGQRPELAVRAAEHTAGLLAVLRTVLAEQAPPEPARPAEPFGTPREEPVPEPAEPPVSRQRVQRIELRRPGRTDID